MMVYGLPAEAPMKFFFYNVEGFRNYQFFHSGILN